MLDLLEYAVFDVIILDFSQLYENILDIATGTADFAISAAKYTNAQIIGIDISEGMLKVGEEKIAKKKLKQ